MAIVIESSVWVDFYRSKTPAAIKELIKPWILRPDAALSDPIVFELLRSANASERPIIKRHFATIPVLSNPPDLWSEATRLGQACHDAGLAMAALDILIATICLHHGAELVTFDMHFSDLARMTPLRLHLLTRGS